MLLIKINVFKINQNTFIAVTVFVFSAGIFFRRHGKIQKIAFKIHHYCTKKILIATADEFSGRNNNCHLVKICCYF